MADSLLARGWKVGVLSYASTFLLRSSSLPEQVFRTTLDDLSEENLQVKLAELSREHGPIGTFIHLPPFLSDGSKNGKVFTEKSEELVKHLFLLAKHLKAPLDQASRSGRAAFLLTVRLDGALGLGQSNDFDPVLGGLFGLVKTLRLEWPEVYCRAVDFSPELGVEFVVPHVLAELDDPDRLLTEVGYGPLGRQTIVVVPFGQD